VTLRIKPYLDKIRVALVKNTILNECRCI